jgi:hypothetical protein
MCSIILRLVRAALISSTSRLGKELLYATLLSQMEDYLMEWPGLAMWYVAH